MSRIAQILKTYNYNINKPIYSASPLFIYEAENKDTALKVALKIYKRADTDIAKYLQKLKSAASQYVVKFYDIINEPQTNQLLIIQQLAPYGNLASALNKTKRLQQQDAFTISKIMLNGHIDILRNGVYWSGSLSDIEITQNGIKLSWNNSIIYSQNNPTPFPDLIRSISKRQIQEGILPFPNSKRIEDLIKVANQNVSEMSLHPLLKKRDKLFKKKGKGWLAFRQNKIKGQYVQQLTYSAISKQHGFVRVKVFQKGQIDPEMMKIYQTKPFFTKILEYYEQNDSFITVSEYANDGNVHSYTKKLKDAHVQLKQNHIQFIFYSLIQPLKFINSSPVISFNLLDIKNVYIQNGIPKIGESMLLNPTIKQILKQRSEVPDFYHKQFKQNPDSRDPKYDTYSLGVLLYKLMYTQYPIFPQANDVSIPPAPSYKKQLIDAIRLFLNRGGTLTELQNELQVSDDIKNQVKKNQKILNNSKGKKEQAYQNLQQSLNVIINDHISELSIGAEQERRQRQKKKDCIGTWWQWLNTRGKDQTGKYKRIHQSNFAFYRECSVGIFVCLFYFFTFFLQYFVGFFNLVSTTRLFTTTTINIAGKNNRIITSNFNNLNQALNMLGNVTTSSQLTDKLGCVLDSNGLYYNFVKSTSHHWYSYLGLSLLLMIIILIIKAYQSGKFSLVRTAYHYYDQSQAGANKSRFAISSYVLFQMWFFMALYCFFYLFNFIYFEEHNPCLSNKNWSSLTNTIFSDRLQFVSQYGIIIMFSLLITLTIFFHVSIAYGRFNYNSLLNPIFIFTPLYIGFFIMMRIGALYQFQPSFVRNDRGIIGNGYMNFIGYFPQFLFLGQFLIQFLIDLSFYKCLDQNIQRFILQCNLDDSIK